MCNVSSALSEQTQMIKAVLIDVCSPNMAIDLLHYKLLYSPAAIDRALICLSLARLSPHFPGLLRPCFICFLLSFFSIKVNDVFQPILAKSPLVEYNNNAERSKMIAFLVVYALWVVHVITFTVPLQKRIYSNKFIRKNRKARIDSSAVWVQSCILRH